MFKFFSILQSRLCKQFSRSSYSCKALKHQCYALTLSNMLFVFESHRPLSHKGIAKCFEIPSTMVEDMLKNAVKIKQAFENSSCSTDAK